MDLPVPNSPALALSTPGGTIYTPSHNGLILTELEYSSRECWRRSRSWGKDNGPTSSCLVQVLETQLDLCCFQPQPDPDPPHLTLPQTRPSSGASHLGKSQRLGDILNSSHSTTRNLSPNPNHPSKWLLIQSPIFTTALL